MSIRAEAEENLRVIRSLMEKATVYRAISAEAAAVGGVLAVCASFAFGNCWSRTAESYPMTQPSLLAFFGLWGAILLIVAIANLLFLRRAALRRGEPLFSSGMRLALTALLPSFAVAGWLTSLVWKPIWMIFAPAIWITCYGLALLAARHFAPRSLAWLGWAFLIAGIWSSYMAITTAWGTLYMIPKGRDPGVWLAWNGIYNAQELMALTFGLFHLIYAACVWPRKSER